MMFKQETNTLIMIVILSSTAAMMGSAQPSFMPRAGTVAENSAGRMKSWYGAHSSIINAFAVGFAASVAGMVVWRHYVAPSSTKKEERHTRNRFADLDAAKLNLNDRQMFMAIDAAKKARPPFTPKTAAISFLNHEAQEHYDEWKKTKSSLTRARQLLSRQGRTSGRSDAALHCSYELDEPVASSAVQAADVPLPSPIPLSNPRVTVVDRPGSDQRDRVLSLLPHSTSRTFGASRHHALPITASSKQMPGLPA